MIALDTNILLRGVLDDHAALSKAARRMMEQDLCHVSLLSIAEMGHVLMSVYEVEPPKVASTCRDLLAYPNIHCDKESRVLQAMDGVDAGVDWFDAMLWADAPEGVTLVTYDKAFAKRATALGWKVESRLPKTRS